MHVFPASTAVGAVVGDTVTAGSTVVAAAAGLSVLFGVGAARSKNSSKGHTQIRKKSELK
jgi:hypothetical protein